MHIESFCRKHKNPQIFFLSFSNSWFHALNILKKQQIETSHVKKYYSPFFSKSSQNVQISLVDSDLEKYLNLIIKDVEMALSDGESESPVMVVIEDIHVAEMIQSSFTKLLAKFAREISKLIAYPFDNKNVVMFSCTSHNTKGSSLFLCNFLDSLAHFVINIKQPASGIICKDFEAIACCRRGYASSYGPFKAQTKFDGFEPGFTYLLGWDDHAGLTIRRQ